MAAKLSRSSSRSSRPKTSRPKTAKKAARPKTTKKTAGRKAASKPARAQRPSASAKSKKTETPSAAGSRLAGGISNAFSSRGLERVNANATPNATNAANATNANNPGERVGVKKGDNLSSISRDQLKQAGFSNPSEQKIHQQANEIAQTNSLKDPDRIQAGKDLALPNQLNDLKTFNGLSELPNSSKPNQVGLVEGDQGLQGIARRRVQEGGSVDGLVSDFNNHMREIGKPHISLDTEQSKANPSIHDFTVRDSQSDRRFFSHFNLE